MIEQIGLRLEGESFSEGLYDLRATSSALTSYRQILDGVLPVVLGRKGMTPALRQSVDYQTRIQPGSLEAFVEFGVSSFVATAHLFQDTQVKDLAKHISAYLKAVINFRRLFAEESEDPNLKIRPENQSIEDLGARLEHIAANKGGIIVVDARTFVMASNTRPAVDRLVSIIDGVGVANATLTDDEREHEVILSSNDEFLTRHNAKELPEFMEVVGHIFSVNYETGRGTIQTDEGKFSITFDEDLRAKIKEFADVPNVICRARPIIDYRRFDDQTIAFHVLNCWKPERVLL